MLRTSSRLKLRLTVSRRKPSTTGWASMRSASLRTTGNMSSGPYIAWYGAGAT
ncbi:hypothetical protein D3C72_1787260 [compost metagenome]